MACGLGLRGHIVGRWVSAGHTEASSTLLAPVRLQQVEAELGKKAVINLFSKAWCRKDRLLRINQFLGTELLFCVDHPKYTICFLAERKRRLFYL